MNRRQIFGALLGLVVAGCAVAEEAADVFTGTWEGPWYRGMTSGRALLKLTATGGTLQMTNLDNFGEDTKDVQRATGEVKGLRLTTLGANGMALAATLNVAADGAQLRGLGKYDGFPLRFELRRMP